MENILFGLSVHSQIFHAACMVRITYIHSLIPLYIHSCQTKILRLLILNVFGQLKKCQYTMFILQSKSGYLKVDILGQRPTFQIK